MTQDTIAQARAVAMRASGGKGRKFLWIGLALALLIAGAGFYAARYIAGSAETEFEAGVQQEMKGIVKSRTDDINNWLKGVLENTARFTNSGIIKDFAQEMDAMGDNVVVMLDPKRRAETSDIGLLHNYLNNFVAYSEFNFGGLLNSRGELYLSTDPAYQSLDSRQRALAQEVVRSSALRFGLARQDSSRGLLLELYMPISAIARNESGGANVVAVLYLTQAISPKMNEIFSLDGYSGQGYAAYLLQKGADNQWQQVAFRQDRVRDIAGLSLEADESIAFALRDSVTGGGLKVYSQGSKAADLDWWVLWELSQNQARAALDQRILDVYLISGMAVLALFLLVVAAWVLVVSLERAGTLTKFQELFKIIDEQKKLLDSINANITDLISLTDTRGVFLYVNQAFADAFARDIKSIPGLDTSAVCGFDTAKRLNSSDQHVLMTGESLNVSETIWMQSRRHYFQISKSPLRDAESSAVIGIVAVYRDVTQTVEAEERNHRVVQQTIDALVRTIEQADPFLGGHSRIMGAVAKMVSAALNLSPKETATIETAATLSQVGKMFVPREVLTKPGALTPEEKKIMEQHVEHTVRVLHNIEFDLPVLDAIAQMNERLDGAGYPKGIKGEEISIYARILSVANGFTAMARPRSYRAAMDAETVLGIMEKDSGAYDPQLVSVLRQVLRTPAGERLVAVAASSKAV